MRGEGEGSAPDTLAYCLLGDPTEVNMFGIYQGYQRIMYSWTPLLFDSWNPAGSASDVAEKQAEVSRRGVCVEGVLRLGRSRYTLEHCLLGDATT